MSVFVSSQVWQRFPLGGGELTLALALADHAHDNGTHIWPKIKTLAAKTRQSERTVQRQLSRFRDDGFILLVNFGNGGRGMSNEYVISPEWLQGADYASLKKGDNLSPIGKGVTGGKKGDKSGENGDIAASPADNRHTQPSSKRKRASALPENWKLPKTWGEWALADERLQKRGFTVDHIRLTAEIFKDHWHATGKPMTDWFATWRNWCRNHLSNPESVQANNAGWFRAYETALVKANEVGVGAPLAGESENTWHARIRAAIDNGGKPPAPRSHVPASPVPSPEASEARSGPSDVSRAALAGAQALLKSKSFGANAP